MQATVLLAEARVGPLTYEVPEDTPAGAVVEAPLGPRRVVGVVWDDGPGPAAMVDAARLRAARILDLPPLPRPLRQLIAWVADWYLAPPGAVLRMALPQAAFMAAPAPAPWLVAGTLPDPASIRHPGRRTLVERLRAAPPGPAPLAGWEAMTGADRKRLYVAAKAGLLRAVPAPAGTAPSLLMDLPGGPVLGAAQAAAAAVLREAVAGRAFAPLLLDGVTGSGKTEVCFEGIAAALEAGRQALVLLPEIALTAAWLERFERRFGVQPTRWHSGMTGAARRDAFAAIARGQARVTVGARSALFLPYPSLGLIVVDEAHDGGFKQEEAVPYHGRDVAVMRARFEEVPVLLSTATPGLETREQVARGVYRRLALPDRHGGAAMPRVTLVDLRRDPPPRGGWISPRLSRAIDARLAAGEQALLYLNRRGYAPLTLCRACGARIQCPSCTAWLVTHRLAGRLQCHHCGHRMRIPETCPACGAADSLVACGPGVERLAEEVERSWPEARVAVASSDTIRTAADMAALVAAVGAGSVDLLIGTQMLAKGHDFPGLTLVGVIDADLGLEGGDPRAAERVFQQMVQVAGRAGRGAKAGEVLLQTWQPQARIMRALASGDAQLFEEADRAAREAAGMPPFGRLAAIIVSSADAAAAADVAAALGRAAPRIAGLEVMGPAPAPLALLRGRHRHRLLVRADRGVALQGPVRVWLARVPVPARVRVSVDVDPQTFL